MVIFLCHRLVDFLITQVAATVAYSGERDHRVFNASYLPLATKFAALRCAQNANKP